MRTDIEAVVPEAPGLQGCAGHLELFGRLTLGEPLSAQRSILFKEVGTFVSIPAWLANRVDVWHVLNDGSHSDLLGSSLAF